MVVVHIQKTVLEDRFDNHFRRCLYDAIFDCRYSQWSCLPIALRDFYLQLHGWAFRPYVTNFGARPAVLGAVTQLRIAR